MGCGGSKDPPAAARTAPPPRPAPAAAERAAPGPPQHAAVAAAEQQVSVVVGAAGTVSAVDDTPQQHLIRIDNAEKRFGGGRLLCNGSSFHEVKVLTVAWEEATATVTVDLDVSSWRTGDKVLLLPPANTGEGGPVGGHEIDADCDQMAGECAQALDVLSKLGGMTAGLADAVPMFGAAVGVLWKLVLIIQSRKKMQVQLQNLFMFAFRVIGLFGKVTDYKNESVARALQLVSYSASEASALLLKMCPTDEGFFRKVASTISFMVQSEDYRYKIEGLQEQFNQAERLLNLALTLDTAVGVDALRMQITQNQARMEAMLQQGPRAAHPGVVCQLQAEDRELLNMIPDIKKGVDEIRSITKETREDVKMMRNHSEQRDPYQTLQKYPESQQQMMQLFGSDRPGIPDVIDGLLGDALSRSTNADDAAAVERSLGRVRESQVGQRMFSNALHIHDGQLSCVNAKAIIAQNGGTDDLRSILMTVIHTVYEKLEGRAGALYAPARGHIDATDAADLLTYHIQAPMTLEKAREKLQQDPLWGTLTPPKQVRVLAALEQWPQELNIREDAPGSAMGPPGSATGPPGSAQWPQHSDPSPPPAPMFHAPPPPPPPPAGVAAAPGAPNPYAAPAAANPYAAAPAGPPQPLASVANPYGGPPPPGPPTAPPPPAPASPASPVQRRQSGERVRRQESKEAEWCSRREGKWHPYAAEDSKTIEALWRAGGGQGQSRAVNLSFSRGQTYEFDFSQMFQRNVQTQKERRIMRR